MWLYSSSTRGFYNPEIHGDKIPEDCVEVPEQRYKELLEARTEILPGPGGAPTAAPRPSEEDVLASEARQQREALLREADMAINGLVDRGEDASAWRQYRQALREVPQQTGFPSTIAWPNRPV